MANILVVEDDPYVMSMLTRGLGLQGHELRTAADGRLARSACREAAPDVVVTDLIMPEVEGLELIREWRRARLPWRILAISGGGLGGTCTYLQAARKLGADETLAKPFGIQDLLSAFDRLSAPRGAVMMS
jgi:DNA-binding response OmpR family regulator